MAKRFNGRKNSHGRYDLPRPTCPMCGSTMRVVQGVLRCTEMKRAGSGDIVTIKHGSMTTIKNRMKQRNTKNT